MNSSGGRRIGFYGGSFDPVHLGHLEIARQVTDSFELDEFNFVPAFHAPHKRENKPASPFHRFAMLAAATSSDPRLRVSTIELDDPENPYTIQTIGKAQKEHPDAGLFFVIGADSWEEITTWREWEDVLTTVNIVVITRPGYEIGFDHVTNRVRDLVLDMRDESSNPSSSMPEGETRTFITNLVDVDISATRIRQMVREGEEGWERFVDEKTARHVRKYGLYR